MTDNNHEARIAVLETEVKAIALGHRDVWTSLDKLRDCLNARFSAIDRDTKSILRWITTGVIGALLSAVAFLFIKIMGWD